MRILPCLNSPCTLYSPYYNPLYYPNPQLAFLTTYVAEIEKFEISLFPVKIEFIFWRFKPALNWNQVLADLRRGVKPGYFELRSNTLNSNTSWITKIKKSMWVLPLKWYQCELLSRRVVTKAECYKYARFHAKINAKILGQPKRCNILKSTQFWNFSKQSESMCTNGYKVSY